MTQHLIMNKWYKKTISIFTSLLINGKISILVISN